MPPAEPSRRENGKNGTGGEMNMKNEFRPGVYFGKVVKKVISGKENIPRGGTLSSHK
jgi:hypothetical protein